jgi:cytidylate kinase
MRSMPTVVAISRQFGSGGAWVGRAVAQQLGYRYADREILAEAALALQADAGDMEPLEERVTGWWERLASMFAQGAVDAPFTPPVLPRVTDTQLFAVERQIIEGIASHGGAVIVGRGAAHILRDRTRITRVFLHAPLEARLALAMKEYGFSSREAALAVLQASDGHRRRFAHALTGRDWYDATQYGLCLDTDAIGLERAVEIIIEVARRSPVTAPLPALAPRAVEDEGGG